MATIYYIDSENVGDSWINFLKTSTERVLVFYTKNSPRIAYPQVIELMNATNKPEFIVCHEGNNGLDFQLVTYLGYELHADSSNEMIIVSKDTGFDAVVLFWTERGMKVKRIPCLNSLNSQSENKNNPVSEDDCSTVASAAKVSEKNTPVFKDEYSAASSSVEVTEKISGVEKEELYAIINCIGKENSLYIHLAFVHFYGNKNGENIYKVMKKEKFAAPTVNWTKEERMKRFIEFIIRYVNTANIPIPESFTGFLMNNVVNDKKAMLKRINKSYGDMGPRLNKMFKTFYQILTKIKE